MLPMSYEYNHNFNSPRVTMFEEDKLESYQHKMLSTGPKKIGSIFFKEMNEEFPAKFSNLITIILIEK